MSSLHIVLPDANNSITNAHVSQKLPTKRFTRIRHWDNSEELTMKSYGRWMV